MTNMLAASLIVDAHTNPQQCIHIGQEVCTLTRSTKYEHLYEALLVSTSWHPGSLSSAELWTIGMCISQVAYFTMSL